MKPIGLTLKDIRGELMVVHLCLNCGKLSINRIAGDDNPHSLLSLLELREGAKGIKLLVLEDKDQVLTALFGYNYPDI